MSENRQKSWFKVSDALIAAFIVPVVIMLIIYAERGIFPFGDRAYLRTDLYHQYAPFLSEFKYKLNSGGSLFHSWDVGMGVNFSAIYAYYLASPFNWIVALVPRAYVIEFISVQIIFKTGLCGLTMAYYLSKHSENSNFAPALFGIFYALSGYLAAYSWNIMWLDCIVLFPLIALGAERLVNEKKGILYTVTLAVCILSNYYISIMVCIFMVFYVVMLLILKGRQSFGSFAGTVGLFALYSLIAGALAAIVWLPELYALKLTASSENDFGSMVDQYFPVLDEIARHMICVETEQGLDHWPNVYCGVAVFPLAILFVANRKISLKEKIVNGFMLVFFLVSFSLNILSFVWHGLHYPNSLPARQSFIYIWMLLYVCFRAVDELEGNTLKDIAIAAIVSIAAVFLFQKIATDDAFDWNTWIVSLAFIAVYSLMLYLHRTEKINVNVATFVLLGLVAIEAAVNMTTTGLSTTSRDQYVKDNEDVRSVVNYVKDDRDFYRFKKMTRKTKDDGAWMNYHSASLFSSMTHADLTELYDQLGCEASTNTYALVGSTPLIDALFDIKYGIYTGTTDNPHVTAVAYSGDTTLYKNEYNLPLGYIVPNNIDELWDRQLSHPVKVQNQLAKAVGAGDVLTQVDGFKEGGVYSFTVPEDGLYFAYSENKATESIDVTIDDQIKNFSSLERSYFLELGWLEKNTIVDFEATDDTDLLVHAFKFNYDALGQIVSALGATKMQVNTYDDTTVVAGIDMSEAGLLATTIPYDDSWAVMVDGVKTQPVKVMGGFLGLHLDAGHHDIVFNFFPEGFTLGATISVIAFIAFILAIGVNIAVGLVKKKKAEKADKALAEAAMAKAEEPVVIQLRDLEIEDFK